jgi:UMF1 family MFS transporter
LQAFLFLSFGALADNGSVRKRFLIITTTVGSLACILLLIPMGNYFSFGYAAFLSVLLTLLFGTSVMLYNSYLPLLVAAHPDTLSNKSDKTMEAIRRQELISANLSAKSLMAGFGAGAALLSIIFGIQALFKLEILDLTQLAIILTGVWWLGGATISFFFLSNRPGPNLPLGINRITFSICQTIRTIRTCRRLPNTFLYILSFFMFSDGCNTIGTVAVVFTKTFLNADISLLMVCSLIAPISGVLGGFFFFWLQPTPSGYSKQLSSVMLFTVVCLQVQRYTTNHREASGAR